MFDLLDSLRMGLPGDPPNLGVPAGRLDPPVSSEGVREGLLGLVLLLLLIDALQGTNFNQTGLELFLAQCCVEKFEG